MEWRSDLVDFEHVIGQLLARAHVQVLQGLALLQNPGDDLVAILRSAQVERMQLLEHPEVDSLELLGADLVEASARQLEALQCPQVIYNIGDQVSRAGLVVHGQVS